MFSILIKGAAQKIAGQWHARFGDMFKINMGEDNGT